jgi:hypothetical protein
VAEEGSGTRGDDGFGAYGSVEDAVEVDLGEGLA